jgi:putative Ca2+/H+ antiporter (TMEM165/GDT1 family)
MLEFIKIFFVILAEEIGDKSQLATIAFASTHSRWMTFFASGTALLVATFLVSFLGGYLQTRVNLKYLSIASGILFIIIGIWTIWTAGKK